MTFLGLRKIRLAWLFFLAIPILYFCFKCPIYSDEIAWKWLTSRFFLDGSSVLTLYPQCKESSSVPIPFLLVPWRVFEGWIYSKPESLLQIRTIGILVGLLIGFLLWRLAKKISVVRQMEVTQIRSVVFAMLLFGVLPFLLVMNRPEQNLVFCVIALVLLPLEKSQTKKRKVILGVGFLFVVLWMFSQHAKALFFLPVALTSYWFMASTKKNKVLGIALLLILTSQCYSFFTKHTECSNEALRASFRGMMVSPSDLVRDPAAALKTLSANVLNSSDYVQSVLFRNEYTLDWLPNNYGFSFGASLMNAVIGVFFLFYIVVSLGSLAGAFKEAAKSREREYLNFMSISLLISLLAFSLFQTGKNFYEAGLVIPIVMLIGVLNIGPEYLKRFAGVSTLIATASVILLCYRFKPNLNTSWNLGGPLIDQAHSIKVSYQREITDRVNQLADKCGLRKDNQVKHLVLDDLTYPFFVSTFQPYHATYVMGWWGKISIPDIENFLSQRESSGVLSQCKWLPDLLLKKAIRDGDLCCLPEFKWDPIPR